MKYPIEAVVRPADLNGVTNGKLPSHLLREVSPRKGWHAHHLAARCWEAMRSAAWNAGILLSVSGNPYRSYEAQVALFQARYTTAGPTNLDTVGKSWQGKRWYRHTGAPCATPGTSNHGLGIAFDVAIDRDGDPEFEWPVKSLDSAALNWLLANARRFGFSWEMQIEPWHLRMVTGDRLPEAVLAYEKSGVGVAPSTPPPVPAPNPYAALAAAIEQAKTYTLRLGSGGADAPQAERDAVVWAQISLQKHGFYQGYKCDGDFGKVTEDAVKAFQKARGLFVDGVIGTKQTWPALLA
jgi:hypothetical protein